MRAKFQALAKQRIVLLQEAEVVRHDEGATSARGDATFFKANLKKGGENFGTLSGMITAHDIAGGGDNEVRLRQLVFDLPSGQLVAMGSSTYKTGDDFVPLEVGRSTTIAIVGGTGDYFGASGQLVTTRRANGTYRQVIFLSRK
jgi:hypothetical protein